MWWEVLKWTRQRDVSLVRSSSAKEANNLKSRVSAAECNYSHWRESFHTVTMKTCLVTRRLTPDPINRPWSVRSHDTLSAETHCLSTCKAETTFGGFSSFCHDKVFVIQTKEKSCYVNKTCTAFVKIIVQIKTYLEENMNDYSVQTSGQYPEP